jgi:hypothetical protein
MPVWVQVPIHSVTTSRSVVSGVRTTSFGARTRTCSRRVLAGFCRTQVLDSPPDVAADPRYVAEGGRSAAIAGAQRAGRYERVSDRWMLLQVRPGGVVQVADEARLVRDVRLYAMSQALRMWSFRGGDDGLEPIWL